MTDRCRFEGLVGCGLDRVATVALKREDVVAVGAGFAKFQNDVDLCAGGPSLRGKPLEPCIGNQLMSIFHSYPRKR